MSNNLERLKALTNEISSYEIERKHNIKRLKSLFHMLKLSDKVGIFENLFDYKAINLSGISLSAENIGKISEGKYAQIIAITYIDDDGKKRAKNINLLYLGRVEKVEEQMKKDIIEFIIRWRLEKSFLGVDHYRAIIKMI